MVAYADRERWPHRIRNLHQLLVEMIPCHPDTRTLRAELRAKSVSDVLIAYMNWVDRLISPRPRKVMVWEGFWRKNRPLDHAHKIDSLIQFLRQGGDLTPYLSRYVRTHGYEAVRERRGIQWQNKTGGHKDFALNVYDLHHLHLTPCDKRGRHPGGSRELLYVGVSREEALLLMLGDHRSFDDGSLHRAVAEHRAIAGWDLKGVKSMARPIDDRGIARLLRRGVTTGTQVGDMVVAAGFTSAAGTSIDHVRWADRIYDFLQEHEPELDDPILRQTWDKKYGIRATASLSWGFHYGDFGLLDEDANIFHVLLQWRR